MGTVTFQLPPNLSQDFMAELERASIAGGQDGMPFPTQVLLNPQQLLLHRAAHESGFLVCPWQVAGMGQLMLTSATLMERLLPYQLPLELARGKVNQLRGQVADWQMGGLLLPAGLAQQIRQATLAFGKAASHAPSGESFSLADTALNLAVDAAYELVYTYISQVFQIRHVRQPRFDSLLSCQLTGPPPGPAQEASWKQAFNAVHLPFAWNQVEPAENQISWKAFDDRIAWAQKHSLHLIGGPLVDFSGHGLPDWIWEKQLDIVSLGGLLTDYVDMVVRRYQGTIRTWKVIAGCNWAGVVAYTDDELLWLTHKLLETVRRIDSQLELVVGIAQPWGDYLAHQERNQSPFVFTDSLLRTGVKLAGLDLEWIMGVTPRGSYCRDLLDASRILDLYALLGQSLSVTLGYPSAISDDERADPDFRVQGGHWRNNPSLEGQADWVHSFASLALCKPYVRCVQWAHWSDADVHHFPHCGLVDPVGRIKPALEQFTRLKTEHLP